ncbi:PRC-barrel domain-containing protein [Chelatococcus reniformis]|uniref:Photosystem reaction center subunit H n=1 Tax=Chelatococcus reniformis TaxID=1494448 RepID=A0A916U018_9HYPH|nr:PRC-barrel domain-containing protein [Chelatococcus reniformis]GGC53933.1 photosystem reaction center subunit H [Chelatococcus reniformis]
MAHAHMGGHVAADETANLIAASKVEGTSVYNSDGDSMGSIYDVMLDKSSGQVAYALMSFGGFLGMGENYHPLPWQKLHYDTGLGGYVVDESPDRLKKAPTITRDYAHDPGWSRRVNDYYGVPI